jgi:hypothetical protein
LRKLESESQKEEERIEKEATAMRKEVPGNLGFNIPIDRLFCTGVFLLTESFVLLSVLYWNIPTG